MNWLLGRTVTSAAPVGWSGPATGSHRASRKSRVSDRATNPRTAFAGGSDITRSTGPAGPSVCSHVSFGSGLSSTWWRTNAARALIPCVGNGTIVDPFWFGLSSGRSPCPAFGT